ncbi:MULTISPECIES: ArsR/SmtB family transcription factor [unclassified Mesorhizobium]|uniref:ArsR/SmtB family transcription factor n=1 Tax=unclassified Mesorhizobium TaxID=325217 RepID=UPI0011272E9E|nr:MULTISPECIES: metalloregulator ArsR/SmtB family transcription factor [unclassified Mesorhizobium]MBZ9701582.1 metalloregulator ArsR/SmtB family transcription factor [Mesorhizobium sp. CO1-1-3]MBZ9949192.1 metalloregulator ArsR/SmtB family transcription factor [Mesorhizobium sp. BR1-1-11]TPI99610.1 winged helix-turn-helix transcriptional regulator [Mesorhizobium sp. B2-8-1]
MVFSQLIANVSQAAAFLRAMSNGRRLIIMSLVLDRELSGEAIREQLRIGPSALSQHMAELRTLGLVRVRYDNNTVYYSSDHHGVRELLVMLDSEYGQGSSNQTGEG